MVNRLEDGLKTEWGGQNVWCNPPYSQPLLHQFCQRFIENGNGTLLTFARTDNADFQELLLNTDAVLFLRQRIRFYLPDGTRGGSPGCGSALFAIGEQNVERLSRTKLKGVLIAIPRRYNTLWK